MKFTTAVAVAGSLVLALSLATGAAGPVAAAPADAAAGEPLVQTENVCPETVAAGKATCFAVKRLDIKRSTGAANAAEAGEIAGLTPQQLRDAYDFPSTELGSGMTVAVVVAYNNPWAESELNVYRAQFGLGQCTAKKGCFRKVNQRGEQRDYPVFNAGWAAEAALDVDMVSAICPKCNILLVEADDNSMDNLGAAVQTAVRLGADVVSNSWGTVDWDQPDSEWGADYRHPGIPIVAASGDYGYLASYPATSQYTVAVGGTSLTALPGSARGWHETGWWGAGSWCSQLNPKPAWQTDTDCPGRMMADISAVADPATGVAVYSAPAGGWAVFGGTSVATPIIAAAYALADDTSDLEFPVSKAYANPAAFNDVVEGANWGDYDCDGNYFCNAGPGYDGLTGLGSPIGLAGL
jgi:subtilase family serine protease